ncbi:hypothetical protein [Parafrankia colletiae]|uniref:hypothetical protein n=1 Tax=Parafrankia colletiae TaxID=573497 RepID=UPI0010420AEF
MIFDEDPHRARIGTAPQVMARLRNLAIAILCLTGTTNIAQALRHHVRRPERPLNAIMMLGCYSSRETHWPPRRSSSAGFERMLPPVSYCPNTESASVLL